MPRIGFTAGSLLVPAGNVNVAQIAGVPSQLDDADKLAVSVYGKKDASGDYELRLDAYYRLETVAGAALAGADGQSNALTGLVVSDSSAGKPVVGAPYLFNGSTWDRQRNNWTSVVLASAARGASINSDDQVNYNHPHFLLTVNITVQTAAETIQLAVELIDPVSGAYSNVWTAAAAIGAVGTYTYLLGPAAVAAVYTEDVHIVMPRDWRLAVTQVGVGPITYSVAVSYIGH